MGIPFILMIRRVALFVGAIVGTGAVYQIIGERRDRRSFPPPGKLVNAGGTRIHVHVQGPFNAPTVLLESGIAASSISWVQIAKTLAQTFQVITYDRAGLAWSAPPRRPRSPEQMASELTEALSASGIGGPFVIVSHSFGGLMGRWLASHQPELVSGLVLLDPAHTCEWANPDRNRRRMLDRGIALSRRGAWLARTGFIRLALNLLTGGQHKLPKLMNKLSSGDGASVPERIAGEARKLPPETWPVMRAFWSRSQAFIAMADHLAVLPSLAAEVVACQRSLGSLPVVVVSQEKTTPEQHAEHASLAALSTEGQHLVAKGGGHWVHLDRPDLVIASVQGMSNG